MLQTTNIGNNSYALATNFKNILEQRSPQERVEWKIETLISEFGMKEDDPKQEEVFSYLNCYFC
jgi:hypothetical protein